MNPAFLVIGEDEHSFMLVRCTPPAPHFSWTCLCGATVIVKTVLPIHTSEYESRCLTTSPALVDERRTTQ